MLLSLYIGRGGIVMDEKLKELFSKNLVDQLLAHGETQASMTRQTSIPIRTKTFFWRLQNSSIASRVQQGVQHLNVKIGKVLYSFIPGSSSFRAKKKPRRTA